MKTIRLTTHQWLGIDPEYRAIVDRKPHVYAYDEEHSVHVLTPVTVYDAQPRELVTAARPLQLA